MRIIVVGAGEVGLAIARQLADEGKDIVLIDNNPDVVKNISSSLDVAVLVGDATDEKFLKKAGIEEQLRKAAKSAVCKINVDSDGRLAFTAKVREYLAKDAEEFDPRKYLGFARSELVKMYKAKNENVMGSAGHGV